MWVTDFAKRIQSTIEINYRRIPYAKSAATVFNVKLSMGQTLKDTS